MRLPIDTSVLSIGSDRNLFDDASAVFMRQAAYAERLKSLTIIVFDIQKREVHAGNLHIISTASWTKILYGFDAWRIGRKIAGSNVVTSQDPFETGLIALKIARALSASLHVQVHTDFLSPYFQFHSIRNWLRTRFSWFVLSRAQGVRTVLERTADALSKAGIQARISTLPIYVDSEQLAHIERTRHLRFKISLVCIGRLEREKRFDRAIEAVVLARKNNHDVGLTIVGDGHLREKLEKMARIGGVAERVVFTGAVRDIKPILASADAVLVPSEYEGYGLVIVEALAAGVPVISTDVGVAKEAGAIIVPHGEFPGECLAWIERGPRQGLLALDMPTTFDAYADLWCDDISRCAK